MLEAGIHQLVAADAGVRALIGAPARFYPVLVPDDPVYPCASFQVISDTPVDLLDGTLTIGPMRLQVDTWSGGIANASYASAKAVQAAIRAVLESFTGALPDGTFVNYIHVAMARDLYEQDARCYRTSTDFMILFCPPQPGGMVGAMGAGASHNFVDDEVVAGSGTSWTLASSPNPVESLQLFVEVPSFGSVLLRRGADYTAVGSAITTTHPYSAGILTAWYRN
jgi:hypothetical protein